MDNLKRAKLQDFDAVYEIGEVMAESIIKFFRNESTQKLWKKLEDAGLNLEEKVASVKKSALTGKLVVFTGELKDFSRKQSENIVREMGGNASSSVSQNTDFLVAGENPGSKYEKAKKLGIKIIAEKEFKEMIR